MYFNNNFHCNLTMKFTVNLRENLQKVNCGKINIQIHCIHKYNIKQCIYLKLNLDTVEY